MDLVHLVHYIQSMEEYGLYNLMCMFAYMYMCTRVCTYCGWMYGSTEVYTYICIYIYSIYGEGIYGAYGI